MADNTQQTTIPLSAIHARIASLPPEEQDGYRQQVSEAVHAGRISVVDDVTKHGPPPTGIENDTGDGPQPRNFAGIKYSFDPKSTYDGGDETTAAGRLIGGARQGLKAAAETGIGVGKGAIDTVYNLANFIANHTYARYEKAGNNPDLEDALKSKNAYDTIGQGTEKAAEFAGGEGIANAGLKGINLASKIDKLPTLLRTGAEAVKDAAVTGGVTLANTGGDTNEAKSAAMWGALLPAAAKGVGAGLRRVGVASELSLLRPGMKEVRSAGEGGIDDIANAVEKYDLGGTLRQTAQKTTAKLNDLSDQLTQALPTTKSVDLISAIDDAAAELKLKAGRNFGQNLRLKGALEQLKQEAAAVAKNVQVDPTTGDIVKAEMPIGRWTDATGNMNDGANDVKRAVGLRGAWEYEKRTDESDAMKTVANTLYTKLRQQIEAAAPEVKGINQQIAELIPVEQAVVKRIPVEARQNLMSLGDIMALASGHIGLYGAKQALRSGVIARGAIKTGSALVRGAGTIGKFGTGIKTTSDQNETTQP